MKERKDEVLVQDIIESLEIIAGYLDGLSEFEFDQRLQTQDAVIRRFEIIGEAASKISSSFREKHPNIEWRLMNDMRNKLIHEYYGVSTSTIYNTAMSDLPKLKDKLQMILRNSSE